MFVQNMHFKLKLKNNSSYNNKSTKIKRVSNSNNKHKQYNNTRNSMTVMNKKRIF